LKGKIAISNAKMAFKRFKEIFNGEEWEVLAKAGAHVQRVLWASTSTKNPTYSDVLYVEELIGPHTVNTMPPTVVNAFRDHGRVEFTLEEGQDKADRSIKKLAELGVNLEKITEKLQKDGVDAFSKSYDELISTLEEKQKSILIGKADIRIPRLGEYQSRVTKKIDNLRKNNFIRRIWEKDYTLWSSKPIPEITDRLGWLSLPETMHDQLDEFTSFAKEIRSEGFKYVVLLGMGGSSLAPEVYKNIFGNKTGYPELIVLDSTHPSAIRIVEDKIDLPRTLFLVSSKSGTTIETISLFRYFWEKVRQIDEDQGRHFVAITDPRTPLVKLAEERGFRRVFQATPDVGGRYSALTAFGLVPASLIGMDVHKFLDRAWIMSESCAFCLSSNEVFGLIIGAALGELTKIGLNKVTFLTSPSISSFPNWAEQLIAESTGKEGKGIIPIVNEPLTSIENYQKDRFFIHFFTEKDNDVEIERLIESLEAKGYPLISINLTDKENLSQEIYCLELAVATAGSIIGINPFNQPNVQMAKDLAIKMMEKTEKGIKDEDVETFSVDDHSNLTKAIKDWLNKAREGDYIAIQAYLSPTPDTAEKLQNIRFELLNRLKLATTLGYGPRFLHSTGQLHKGGPNTGLFIQLIDEPKVDIKVPETDYTFGRLIRAQALGDYKALKKLGRRVLRINLKGDVDKDLSSLIKIIQS
ncbi:MAG: bifunctional transaldolase/phosoglucose isomerase, partial [Candidatus Bathyarchaeota archaeon]|nr:bifunctional transaldolase/phosoglucose isomerase [Candidatus Bathyarchaeota archaeon]